MVKAFEDEFIAFHRPSGATHLLNASSASLISEILIEAKSTDEIAKSLSINISNASNRSLEDELLATLDYLEEIGLLIHMR